MSESRASMTDKPTLPTVKPQTGATRLNLLVYGKPGVGKTSLAGTAEDDERTRPVLFVDLEGGILSIAHRGSALDVYPITGNFDAEMNQLVGYLLAEARSGQMTYKTLVIDSISELCDRAMASIQAKSGRSSSDKSSWDDWNAWTNKMRTLLGIFRDLPMNIISTALEDEDEGQVSPLFPGKKVSIRLPGYFDTVARQTVRTVTNGQATEYRRVLQLQPDARVLARDRADRIRTLPREMIDPTVSSLMDRLEESQRVAELALSNYHDERLATTTKGSK